METIRALVDGAIGQKVLSVLPAGVCLSFPSLRSLVDVHRENRDVRKQKVPVSLSSLPSRVPEVVPLTQRSPRWRQSDRTTKHRSRQC